MQAVAQGFSSLTLQGRLGLERMGPLWCGQGSLLSVSRLGNFYFCLWEEVSGEMWLWHCQKSQGAHEKAQYVEVLTAQAWRPWSLIPGTLIKVER